MKFSFDRFFCLTPINTDPGEKKEGLEEIFLFSFSEGKDCHKPQSVTKWYCYFSNKKGLTVKNVLCILNDGVRRFTYARIAGLSRAIQNVGEPIRLHIMRCEGHTFSYPS